MICKSRGMFEWVTCSIHVLLFMSATSTVTANSLNSQSQNAINPRNSSTEIPQDETCQPHSADSSMKSACKIACVKDDDCINHGQRICCPAQPGSSCIGECLTVELESDRTTKTCIDIYSRKRYITGETFIRADKCCTCHAGGIDCLASTINTCHLGCWKNSKYFKHGQSIPSKPCNNCSCRNGSVICSSDVKCLQGSKCSYRGKFYEEGDLVHLQGGCKECVCRSGRWSCIAVTCSAVSSRASLLPRHLGAFSHTGFLVLIMFILS